MRMTTLDALWQENGRENVGFVKVDTEGWDAYVIMSGKEMIRTCRPPMLIEFNRERMRNHNIPLEPCWQFLVAECGYRCFRHGPNRELLDVEEPGEFEDLFFVQRHPKAV